jgi:Tol biopolymer transport system component
MGPRGGRHAHARICRARSKRFLASRTKLPGSRMAVAAGLVGSLVTLGTLTLVPSVAEAAFPGQNGLIVFVGGASCSGRHHDSSFEHSSFENEGSNGGQLFELRAGTRRPIQLTCTGGRDQHPFVSPDGSEVVFSNVQHGGPGQLFTLTVGSSHESTKPTLVSGAADASDDYPSWSPAGGDIIIFQRTIPGGLPQLYTENVANPSSAAPLFPTPTGFSDTEPVFDPADPNTVAFVRSGDGDTHIFSYEIATQALTDLSAQGNSGSTTNDSKPDYAPSLSNGQIVFESDRACGRLQLYTMALDGTHQTPLFQTWSQGTSTGTQKCTPGASDPVFSPQDDAVAFDRQVWGTITQLEEVPLNPSDTALRAFTRNDGNRSFFDFGAQPNWGPSASPPAQAPEFSVPVILPVVGSVAAGGALLIARRRRLRTAHR